jgi:3-deoxy-D-manno-octulosonic-acid transferase
MNRFRASDAIFEVTDDESLEQAVGVLLSTPGEANSMGARAARVVKQEQGATDRHVRVILQILETKLGSRAEDVSAGSRIGSNDLL